LISRQERVVFLVEHYTWPKARNVAARFGTKLI